VDSPEKRGPETNAKVLYHPSTYKLNLKTDHKISFGDMLLNCIDHMRLGHETPRMAQFQLWLERLMTITVILSKEPL